MNNTTRVSNSSNSTNGTNLASISPELYNVALGLSVLILVASGAFFNLILIIAAAYRRRSIISPFSRLLISIGAANLLDLIINQPIVIIAAFGVKDFLNQQGLCMAISFTTSVTATVSLLAVTLLTIDRFIATWWQTYQDKITPVRAIWMIVYSWFHGVLLSIPLLTGAIPVRSPDARYVCVLGEGAKAESYGWTASLLCFLFPIISTFILLLLILVKYVQYVTTHKGSATFGFQVGPFGNRPRVWQKLQVDFRLCKCCVANIALWLLLRTPFVLFFLLPGLNNVESKAFGTAITALFFVYPTLSPLLTLFLNQSLRSRLKHLINRHKKKRPAAQPRLKRTRSSIRTINAISGSGDWNPSGPGQSPGLASFITKRSISRGGQMGHDVLFPNNMSNLGDGGFNAPVLLATSEGLLLRKDRSPDPTSPSIFTQFAPFPFDSGVATGLPLTNLAALTGQNNNSADQSFKAGSDDEKAGGAMTTAARSRQTSESKTANDLDISDPQLDEDFVGNLTNEVVLSAIRIGGSDTSRFEKCDVLRSQTPDSVQVLKHNDSRPGTANSQKTNSSEEVARVLLPEIEEQPQPALYAPAQPNTIRHRTGTGGEDSGIEGSPEAHRKTSQGAPSSSSSSANQQGSMGVPNRRVSPIAEENITSSSPESIRPPPKLDPIHRRQRSEPRNIRPAVLSHASKSIPSSSVPATLPATNNAKNKRNRTKSSNK